jgi:hypothetical protein
MPAAGDSLFDNGRSPIITKRTGVGDDCNPGVRGLELP